MLRLSREAAGASLGRHLVQQHVPITRKNYNVGFYWPITVVEGCPEKTTYRDARREVKLRCLLGGGHSPGDLVFIACWGVHSRVGRGVTWLRVWGARGCR